MVVSGSAKHAIRVQQAVMKALIRRGDVTEFFTRDQAEPFIVVTLAEAVGHSRDRVILSVGFGRTPHGRTLSQLGPLARPGGERLLAAAVTRARRSLAIVSCFRPDDLDGDRMPAGVLALRRLLADAEGRIADDAIDDDRDAMLVDLARRLRALGMQASLGYHGKLGLVAAHGARAITVETDAALQGASLRQWLRLRPEMLKRLGLALPPRAQLRPVQRPGRGRRADRDRARRAGAVAADDDDPDRRGQDLTEPRRRHRRVRTDPVAGLRPDAVGGRARGGGRARARWGDAEGPNDARLRADKPPHWG